MRGGDELKADDSPFPTPGFTDRQRGKHLLENAD
jgi:hypothetical protein